MVRSFTMNKEKIKQMKLLRLEGKSYSAIALELEVSASMVYRSLHPDKYGKELERNRIYFRNYYRENPSQKVKVECPKCNNKMLVSSKICYDCRKIWNRETITKAIKEFVSVHNRLPTAKEWQKQSDSAYPSYKSVLNTFGRWNKAIEAAGFTPRTSRKPEYQ